MYGNGLRLGSISSEDNVFGSDSNIDIDGMACRPKTMPEVYPLLANAPLLVRAFTGLQHTHTEIYIYIFISIELFAFRITFLTSVIKSMRHVVLASRAQSELSHRQGIGDEQSAGGVMCMDLGLPCDSKES